MSDKLYGFQRLDDFLFKNTGVRILTDKILVKCPNSLPVIDEDRACIVPEIISLSVKRAREGNQLCQGYHKSKNQWNSLNTTNTMFRTKLWARIFETIGTTCALDLLKNACILQQIKNNYILLSGDINTLQEKKYREACIQRNSVFKGKPSTLLVSVDDAIHAVLQNVMITQDNSKLIGKRIEKCIKMYNQLPIRAIFKSYVIEMHGRKFPSEGTSIIDDQVTPEIIANFLFIISKKFLRPILCLRSFRVLKGKFVAVLKRNLYESINHEDLSNHFSASKFKLFADCVYLSNTARLKIIKRLMNFLFTSIYLKIVDFFFYSTTASFSKLKIHYFTRIDWNNKTTRFFQEHLKTYKHAKKTLDFATLRCIPKETGFRVITNCSRITSYRTKNQMCRQVGPVNIDLDKGMEKYQKNMKMYGDWEANNVKSKAPGVSFESRQRNTEKFTNYKNNSLNSKVSCIVPIMKKVAMDTKKFSLMRHHQIKSKHLEYMKHRKGRVLLMKIDLEKCFDNIPHAELMDVVDKAFDRDEYYLREFRIIRESKYQNRLETRYQKHSPDILYPMYMAKALPVELCDAGKNGLCIIKENKTTVVNRSSVLDKIKHVVKESTVLHQNTHYVRTIGIQQGCSISSYLCSIYYSALDKEFPDLDWKIVRYVDDFLVMTEHPEHILRFLDIANSLQSKGFSINHKKVSSNFDLDQLKDSGNLVFTSDHIEWCGIQIYDMGVAMKSVCKDPYFRFSVSIGAFERGVRVLEKIKKSMGLKLSGIYINRYNKKIGECIFDALLFASRRLKVMVLRMDFVNSNFIEKTLDWCVCEVKKVISANKIMFDASKIENIANAAYEKCGIRNLIPNVRNFD